MQLQYAAEAAAFLGGRFRGGKKALAVRFLTAEGKRFKAGDRIQQAYGALCKNFRGGERKYCR